jgi:glutathionylspermidine synthase
MKRKTINPRANWQDKVSKLGFTYFDDAADGVYWREDAYYEFSRAEVDNVYEASKELFQLCLKGVQYVIDNNLFHRFDINEALADQIRKSWDREDPTLYGRFDLTIGKDGNYKMLEFNGDTPTSLFEASIVQWDWMTEVFGKGNADQFNSIHEEMIAQWKWIRTNKLPIFYGKMYFTSIIDPPEDLVTTLYIKSLADEAGLNTDFIAIGDIGHDGHNFVDLHDKKIEHLFKLYPWEWLMQEQFSQHAFNLRTWIEPVWKMLLSNKAILPILWKMAPNHPNLLPAYFEDEYVDGTLKYFVKKPILSREGNNVTITSETGDFESAGIYGEEIMIIQETCTLPQFDGNYAVIGSWIVGEEPCGMGIREDATPITKNTSKFVPHVFV